MTIEYIQHGSERYSRDTTRKRVRSDAEIKRFVWYDGGLTARARQDGRNMANKPTRFGLLVIVLYVRTHKIRNVCIQTI